MTFVLRRTWEPYMEHTENDCISSGYVHGTMMYRHNVYTALKGINKSDNVIFIICYDGNHFFISRYMDFGLQSVQCWRMKA